MEETFEQVYAACGEMLYRLAALYLGSAGEAEDVLQDVFVKLLSRRRTFQNEEHRKRWLIRVAVNQCKSTLRSTWLRRTVPLEEQTDTPVFDRPEQSELFDQVMALPKNYRLVVYLYYYEGYQAREIAELTHRNLSTVQTWLMRARGQLQRSLKEAWSRNG